MTQGSHPEHLVFLQGLSKIQTGVGAEKEGWKLCGSCVTKEKEELGINVVQPE